METSYADAFKNEKKDTKDIVNEKFKPAIEEINKTIKYLQTIKQALVLLEKDLPIVNSTAIGVAANLAVDILNLSILPKN